jgi:cytochrome c biogenesis protein CcdA
MIEVTYAGAFIGGVLTLLSPCSALLLPAFFAYAFQRPGQLFLRTGVFFVGMASVLVPLGMGIAAVSKLVHGHRSTVIAVAGGVIIIMGALQLAGRGFTVLPAARLPHRLRGDTVGSTFALGAVHGLAGFCAGPLLGAVLTMAATSDGPAAGATLLAVYAAGMTVPLLGLALVWDRVGPRLRGRLRGRALRLGGWRVHSTALISGTLFIAIGVTFIATEGTVSLSGLYGNGSTDLAFRLQERVVALTAVVPDGVFVSVVALGAAGALWLRSRAARLRAAEPPVDRHVTEQPS